jgi:hypothetical protein
VSWGLSFCEGVEGVIGREVMIRCICLRYFFVLCRRFGHIIPHMGRLDGNILT